MEYQTSRAIASRADQTPVRGHRPSAVVLRQTGLAVDRVQGEAVVTRVQEHERAILASEAMEHITALSALEANCIEMAPLADPRLKAVGDAFALAAARAVTNYGR